MARPKAALVVTKVDRRVLDSMAHRARTAPQLARRARIVLACATGRDNTTVAKKLRMSKPTVGRWRQRFIDKGVDGLLDEPRPGACASRIPNSLAESRIEATLRGAWRLAYDNRGAQPRVVEGPHAVDLRRRTHGGPCRAEQCPLDLPLPGLGPAPSGGLTTNSRRTGKPVTQNGIAGRVEATGRGIQFALREL